MNRQENVTKYINKEMRGIEIAPWHSPLAPKRDGWNCLSLDLFSLDELQKICQQDQVYSDILTSNIEEVDIIGSATDIQDLIAARGETGTFDYVISSHNFEHLPNPIKFLQGTGSALKENGILSMAIPDKRGCFDYFRPHSETADFLEAYEENRVTPTAAQIFSQEALKATDEEDTVSTFPQVFLKTINPRGIQASKNLTYNYKNFIDKKKEKITDSGIHCHVFVPASFHLIMLELQFLDIIPFHVIEVEETDGFDFYVHMKKMPTPFTKDQFHLFRQHLLHKINNELAFNSIFGYNCRSKPSK